MSLSRSMLNVAAMLGTMSFGLPWMYVQSTSEYVGLLQLNTVHMSIPSAMPVRAMVVIAFLLLAIMELWSMKLDTKEMERRYWTPVAVTMIVMLCQFTAILVWAFVFMEPLGGVPSYGFVCNCIALTLTSICCGMYLKYAFNVHSMIYGHEIDTALPMIQIVSTLSTTSSSSVHEGR